MLTAREGSAHRRRLAPADPALHRRPAEVPFGVKALVRLPTLTMLAAGAAALGAAFLGDGLTASGNLGVAGRANAMRATSLAAQNRPT